MGFKGAIFDLDGVIVDTVPLHFKAWKKMFGEYGTRRNLAFEKMFRDAKLLELGAGTTVINLMTAARNELGLVK